MSNSNSFNWANGTEWRERLVPDASQWIVIYWIIGYTGIIAALWKLPILKHLLWPFKVFTVTLHEFGHASVGFCTGAKVHSITVDPDEGGLTKMSGGNLYLSLPSGYLSSSFWGAVMLFCGFNVLSAKIASAVVGVCMLATLIWAKNWLTRSITVFFIVSIGLLWYFLPTGLRFFILFLGVMSSLYAVWDILEDLVFRKVNESDASAFSRICCGGCVPPQWFAISLVFVSVGVILGIAVFKRDE